MRNVLTVLLLSILYVGFAQEGRLFRFPAISDKQIVFTYAGDLYSVDISGGTARRLTSHIGYEMFPRFSPDGNQIAFTAQYDGNTEVYLMPAQGGVPKRLTYTATLSRDDVADRMGPNNIVMGWTMDNNIIFRSRCNSYNSFVGQLFKVDTEGRLPVQLPFSEGGFCSFSPDGDKIAFNRVFREFRTWKYYEGGMADDIWVFDFKSKELTNITNNVHQDIFPMWKGEIIYFLSDRERNMNLYSYNVKTKETNKLTDFIDYDIKFPSLGGNYIVFEKGGWIFTYHINTHEIKKVSINLVSDNLYSRSEIKDASEFISTLDVSPHGERVVINARGDIFSLPATKGITYNLTRTSGIHERNVAWSPDGKYLAYISDASGENEIWIKEYQNPEKSVRLTKSADTYYYFLRWSPDSKKIAWNDRKGRLQLIDINSQQTNLVVHNKFDIIQSFNWSPDSKWIVFEEASGNGMNIISLFNLETKKTIQVTNNWYNSGNPDFSNDGKYLVFTSDRDFKPVYSEVEWNYAYVDMGRVYLLLLRNTTLSPFAPENNNLSNKINNNDTSKKFRIDVEGLSERLIPLPIDPANYSNILMADNKIYYTKRQINLTKSKTYVYDLVKKQETEIGEGLSFCLSADAKKMLVKQNKNIYVIDLPVSKVSLSDPIDLSGMKVQVNYQLEWKQIFDESWRQMRDFFYVENMAGVNWQAMYKKYAELVPYVNHRNDLTYIIGEMIAELNTGHAYVNSGDRPSVPRIQTGLLGAVLQKHSSGYFVIEKILKGATWGKGLESPLLQPGLNVMEGNFIIEVNGVATNTTQNIYELLVNTAGKATELTVNTKPEKNNSRKIIVIPIADESPLYYYNWVQRNIEKVEKATNGEVGYLHIPDMSSEGLNEFVKYYYPQLTKKGLIIDNRGNGGGNVSPMILERLQRELTRAKMTRNMPYGKPVPEKIFLGPMVALIDKYSASDGDLFAYGFRKHQLGTLIGTRTWGGVVGISGSLPFVDGSQLRKPEYASYAGDKSEWIVEGYGVDPDIVIDNNPYDEYLGKDAQLDKAIDLILEKIKTEYKPVAPIPAAPDKSIKQKEK